MSTEESLPPRRWYRYEVTYADGTQYITHGRDEGHAMDRLTSYRMKRTPEAVLVTTKIECVGTVKAP